MKLKRVILASFLAALMLFSAGITAAVVLPETSIVAEAATSKKPGKPALSSVSNAKTGIKITWKKASNTSGYYIYRKTGSGKWKRVGKANAKTTSFVDKTAKNGKTYRYTVRAYWGSVKSSYNTTGLKIRRTTVKTVLKAYKTYLKKYNRSHDGDPRFLLGYIDSDALPELLIAEGSFHISRVMIYTYYNGKVCKLIGKTWGHDGKLFKETAFGETGAVNYAPKKNLIFSFHLQTGIQSATFYKIKNGSLQRVKAFYDDLGFQWDSGDTTYKINNKKVSKKTYNKQYNSLKNKYSLVTAYYGDGSFITDSNLNDMVKHPAWFLAEKNQ